ncbi:MAG TPA: hypothetical protein VJJ21_02270 [Candidatus Nanoarchaeia archaeon]|nr:hypothetical protein [Candidatus Nanoarchaeia archaeon]
MTELIACLSSGKGTWGHVNQVIEQGNFTKAFLLTNEFGMENFKPNQKTELILINSRQGLKEMRDEIYTKLKDKISQEEAHVAVNMVSGEGKEHMALLSALLKLGLGIRQMALTKDGIEEI